MRNHRTVVFGLALLVGSVPGCGSGSARPDAADIDVSGAEDVVQDRGEGLDATEARLDGETQAVCLGGYYWYQGYCYEDHCPPGAFLSDTANLICSACGMNCDTCTDATACTACSAGFYLFRGSCHAGACPVGTVLSDAGTRICSSCESNCDACSDETTCTACSAGYYLSQGHCYAGACPEGTFLSDPVNRVCGACSEEYYLYQGNCYPLTCPSGSYLSDAVNRICSACQSHCDACVNATTCTKCLSEYNLEQGLCINESCPRPVITIDESDEVIPQTVIHLHGEQSQPASSEVVSYSWTVTQPTDNRFNLVPSATASDPTHQVNVAGEYEYCLNVCNAVLCSADAACNTTMCKIVRVVPNEAIHIELTWDTPGDADQTDEGDFGDFKGSDMDLHFLHPFAVGADLNSDGKMDGWFDLKWDCFWMNLGPEWDGPGEDGNPRLARVDEDGAGPEILSLPLPTDGRYYRVGVGYWDEWGFGPSYPRVKIFIHGELVFERDLKSEGKQITECQMWEVARIVWGPSPKVESADVDGQLNIIMGQYSSGNQGYCQHHTPSDWGGSHRGGY